MLRHCCTNPCIAANPTSSCLGSAANLEVQDAKQVPTSKRSATVRGIRRMRRSRSSECFRHAGSSSWAICIANAAATLSCRHLPATYLLVYLTGQTCSTVARKLFTQHTASGFLQDSQLISTLLVYALYAQPIHKQEEHHGRSSSSSSSR